MDLEEFKYGGTNITAFRLVDPEKPEVQQAVKDWIQGEARHGRKLDMDAAKVKVCTRWPSILPLIELNPVWRPSACIKHGWQTFPD